MTPFSLESLHYLLHVNMKFNVTVNQNPIRKKLSLLVAKHHTYDDVWRSQLLAPCTDGDEWSEYPL